MLFIKWNETLWWILNADKRCVVFSLLLIYPEIPDCHIRYPVFSKKSIFIEILPGKYPMFSRKADKRIWQTGFDNPDFFF